MASEAWRVMSSMTLSKPAQPTVQLRRFAPLLPGR